MVPEGIVILILVLTKFRQAVMESVPLALKHSIAVGLGLFIAVIGFVDAGFVTTTTLPESTASTRRQRTNFRVGQSGCSCSVSS